MLISDIGTPIAADAFDVAFRSPLSDWCLCDATAPTRLVHSESPWTELKT